MKKIQARTSRFGRRTGVQPRAQTRGPRRKTAIRKGEENQRGMRGGRSIVEGGGQTWRWDERAIPTTDWHATLAAGGDRTAQCSKGGGAAGVGAIGVVGFCEQTPPGQGVGRDGGTPSNRIDAPPTRSRREN